MTYDNEAVVRQAYHAAEGAVLDVAGFAACFAKDGVINLGHAGIEPRRVGRESYRGAHLGDLVLRIARPYPDIHRELFADFWYLRDGKITMFNCYIMLTTMRAQTGVAGQG